MNLWKIFNSGLRKEIVHFACIKYSFFMGKVFLGILLASLALGGYFTYVTQFRGVAAKIVNVGSASIRNLKISVTGNTYERSELKPGEHWITKLQVTGESGVTVEFDSENSGHCRLPHSSYFEDDFMYHGFILVELDSKICEPVVWKDNIRIGFF